MKENHHMCAATRHPWHYMKKNVVKVLCCHTKQNGYLALGSLHNRFVCGNCAPVVWITQCLNTSIPTLSRLVCILLKEWAPWLPPWHSLINVAIYILLYLWKRIHAFRISRATGLVGCLMWNTRNSVQIKPYGRKEIYLWTTSQNSLSSFVDTDIVLVSFRLLGNTPGTMPGW